MHLILAKYPIIKNVMLNIAKEKLEYFELLKEEVQMKYKKKQVLEELFDKIKNDEWTSYMSLKR